MSERSFFESVARACAHHPWRVLILWGVAVAAGLALVLFVLGGALSSESGYTSDPESIRAEKLIDQRLGREEHATELVVVHSDGLEVEDPAFQNQVNDVLAAITGLGKERVQAAIAYTVASNAPLVSTDHHSAVVSITMTGDVDGAEKHLDALRKAVLGAVDTERFEVLLTGDATITRDFTAIGQEDLRSGETFGIGIALVILVLVFGALVAAGIPLLLAGVSIILALGMAALVGQLVNLNTFISNMITMIGLAMGIDYSLFILSRYREERWRGAAQLDAIARAGATAGRAVVFSGGAVVLALAGLFIVPADIFHSMALGAILAVVSAVLGALTLLPALLGILGDRVNRLRVPFIKASMVAGEATAAAGDPATASGGATMPAAGADASSAGSAFWHGLAHGVMRRPVVCLVVACVVLLIPAIFGLQLKEGAVGVDTLPGDMESLQAYQALSTDFPASLLSGVYVVVDGNAKDPAVQRAIGSLTAKIQADEAFEGPITTQATPKGDMVVLSFPQAASLGPEQEGTAASRLRNELIPSSFDGVQAEVLVTGPAASTLDYVETIAGHMPWVFLLVLGLSFVLLTVVFRSIVVPAKAILMNLLSVGAAYGLIVIVFQKGWGAGLLGFQQVSYIEAWVPLFLFAILFGTSMDYHVFLLSRIREHFDISADNAESVAFGLSSTARIITGAAVIMVAVFGGFATGKLAMFQQLGFGLAVAVLLDATIIRIVLVPSAMKLLGSVNWWLPRWLHWLPDLRVEGRKIELGNDDRIEAAGGPEEGQPDEGLPAQEQTVTGRPAPQEG